MNVPLTCQVLCYNEASRLPRFLDHATRWADEILILDKQSTDGTREIAEARGARVVSVPFSRAGHENVPETMIPAQYDWLFCMTPGEVPTRELISRVRALLDDRESDLDLIYLPKKLYSFGIHDTRSPWSISYQPFLLNRRRARISAQVHRAFAPSSESRAAIIEFSEACHVLHLTHATVERFLTSHVDYLLAEAAGCTNPRARMAEASEMIQRFEFGDEPELVGQKLAWQFYWLGVALGAWEKLRKRDVLALYGELTEAALKEWRG